MSDSKKIAPSLHTSEIVDRTGSKRIDLNRNNNGSYIYAEQCFNIIGCYIYSLSLIGICDNDVITIMHHCRHVEFLKLKHCFIGRDVLCHLNLKALVLNECFFDEVCWNGLTTLKSLVIQASASDLIQLDQLLKNNGSIEYLKLNSLLEFDYLVLTKLKKLQYLSIEKPHKNILDISSQLKINKIDFD